MASALRDRSLKIAYHRPGLGGYVNSAGEPVAVPPGRQAITWINRGERPVAAVIYQESKFKADARSKSGAVGLMQLLPDTAKGIAVHTGGTQFVVSDLYNPEINVRYGAWYLHHLLAKYGDERTALAAYNAGQENVDRWRAEGKGIQFSETRAYVERVEDLKKIYANAYGSQLDR